MRNVLSTTLLVSALALPAAGLVGCANETESQKTQAKAMRVQDAANMIAEGEGKEADGKAMIAKGEAVRDQGNRPDGERMIASGQSMRDEGRKLIEKGKQLRN